MVREKFVVRLLDADGALLSWAEVWASPQPQRNGASCPFWPSVVTKFGIERSGTTSHLTVHWCDLDIARQRAIEPPVSVTAGQVFDFTWMEPVWLVAGMRDVPLPAVTVKQSIAIGVPVGSMAAVGQG